MSDVEMEHRFEPARPGPDEGYDGGPGESQELPNNTDATSTMGNNYDSIPSDLFGHKMNLSAPDIDILMQQIPSHMMRALASRLLQELPTSQLASLVEETYPRLHLDPGELFPTEIMQKIYAYLAPLDVLRCARTSRSWRAATLANTRWRDFFLLEGWVPDDKALKTLTGNEESRRKDQNRLVFRKQSSSERQSLSKRQRSADQRTSIIPRSDVDGWNEQYGQVEADVDAASSMDVQPSLPYRPETATSVGGTSPPTEPRLFKSFEQTPCIDWAYLYKQRFRLERNWDEGRYIPFRLPSVEHASDGHTDCVYTIQYTGNYLVSGSRDKTIKIWDLSNSPTKHRCIRTLDKAHTSSVLCLQFDVADDVVISGGSDASLIIWRFSTGQIIKKMTDAHRESILNLRFDDRYLITCSKDRTIKIFNRQPISKDDPIVPAASVDLFASMEFDKLPPYTLLGTLFGHTAAVNAIQLFEGSIVSASGDRTIKLWDINTLTCIRQFKNHVKGIACLQFDGRRIVSGSSDKTVRIFDVATAAQVACLAGHQDLVRTVQARFCDHNVSDDELAQQAREEDEAVQQRIRKHPEDARDCFQAFGAKVPNGGGGNRWSRIVSGSYDEAVVVWKKGKKGDWVVGKRLYQDQILQDARREQNTFEHLARADAAAREASVLMDAAARHLPRALPAIGRPVVGGVPAHGHAVAPNGVTTLPQAPWPPNNELRPGSQQWPDVHSPTAPGHLESPNTANGATGAGPSTDPTSAIAADQAQPTQQAQPAQPPVQDIPIQPEHGQGQGGRPAEQQRERRAEMYRARIDAEESKRLLKLQFDSRRIICCSQNRMMVGWDFANGDVELEEASMCFAETQ